MSDAVSLEFIGATLRAIQAEQHVLRGEKELIRKELGRLLGQLSLMATREELLEVRRVLADRIGNFEALMQARFDQLLARLPEGGRT